MSDKNGTGKLEEYAPDQFIVPARDTKGVSVREWVRVQPAVHHEIDAIIQSKKWPWRTRGDFMRWAIYDAVKRTLRLKEVPNSMVIVAEQIMQASRESELWHTFRTSINELERAVRNHIEGGNEQEALKLLSTARANVLKLEEAPWREQYLREFEQRFGHIWERNKGKQVRLDRAVKEGKRGE